MKKKEKEEVVEASAPVCEISPKIALLSIDYGREDLNDMGRKINEIITHINER